MSDCFHLKGPCLVLRNLALTTCALISIMTSAVEGQNSIATLLPPTINGVLVFADGSLSGPVTQAEIQAMGARKMKIDQGHSDAFLMLKGELVPTPSLESFGKAMKDGATNESHYGCASAVCFIRGFAILEFLRRCAASRVSHFEENWMGSISVRLIDYYEDADLVRRNADAKAGKTLLDYVANGEIKNLHREGNILTYSSSFQDHRVEWLASGDFDHDGLEDRLILLNSCSREGSFRSSMTYVVSRDDRKQKNAKVCPFPEENMVAH